MLWVFKDLAMQLTEKTQLECVLPGEVVTLQEPHFEMEITSWHIEQPEQGLTQFAEMATRIPDEVDRRAFGASHVKAGLRIMLRADGQSSDFTFSFLQASFAAQTKAGLRKDGIISVARNGGNVQVLEESVDWPGPGQFQGTIGNTAVQTWECLYSVELRENAEYVVETPGE